MKETINIPSCTSLCVYFSLYSSQFLLTLNPLSCVQPHSSFHFTHIHLSSPSVIRTSTRFRWSKSLTASDLYFSPLLLSKIFISLFLSNPLTSWEVREVTYKSDPGPLGLMGKRRDVLLSPLFFTELLLLSSTEIHRCHPPAVCVFSRTFTVGVLCVKLRD